VSRQTVNAIEKERYDPSLPLAFKIAAVFNLDIEDALEPGESEVPMLNDVPKIKILINGTAIVLAIVIPVAFLAGVVSAV